MVPLWYFLMALYSPGLRDGVEDADGKFSASPLKGSQSTASPLKGSQSTQLLESHDGTQVLVLHGPSVGGS